jgi:hypothetical protein
LIKGAETKDFSEDFSDGFKEGFIGFSGLACKK